MTLIQKIRSIWFKGKFAAKKIRLKTQILIYVSFREFQDSKLTSLYTFGIKAISLVRVKSE